MKAICPELDTDLVQHPPQYSVDLGVGYVLLRPRENIAQEFSLAELNVIQAVCDKKKRQKWGRLQLPNGQIARSLCSENKRTSENKQVSHNVKVNISFYFSQIIYMI